MELAQQLQAQQGNANRMSQFGSNQSAEALRRMMAANQSVGDMAGKQRSQGFDEQATKARAHDSINQLNAGYSQWAQQGNNQNKVLGFDMHAKKAAGKTGQYNQNANATQQAGNQNQAFLSGVGQAGAQTVATLTDEEKKKKAYG